MVFFKKLLQFAVRLVVFPLVFVFYLLRRILVVELVLPNATLFGHLALEPEKILCNLALEKRLRSNTRRRFQIWSFGKAKDQVNKTLVEIWRRQVFSLPSMVVDAIHRASKWLPHFEIAVLQFDKLHENDHVLDLFETHLRLRPDEIARGEDYLASVGIKPGQPYACLIVREVAWAPPITGPLSSGELRSRHFDDFVPAAVALIQGGVPVIKLGAPGTTNTTGTSIIDYANSEAKSEFLDIFLPSRARCVISTMSGPDAVALAARVPVLYIDIAQYSLCFAGTKLVTWVPAQLRRDASQAMTLDEVFKSGAGRFLGKAAFDDAGITIVNCSPEQIREHALAFLDHLTSSTTVDSEELQDSYRRKFHALLSERAVAPLAPFQSRLSEVFLRDHGRNFLS